MMLKTAREKTFREAYQHHSDQSDAPTLSDNGLGLIGYLAQECITASDLILSKIPESTKGLFKEFQEMETERGAFFERFMLLLRSPMNGLLIGFGTDEMYYVLVAWDDTGIDTWKPSCDVYV